MRLLCGRSIGVFVAFGLLVLTVLPARADSTLDLTGGPSSLAIPAAALPAGFSMDRSQSAPITRKSLLPTLGKHASAIFQRAGWVTGYHGWLDANDLTYNAFVTYDFYGFKSASGAAAANGLLLGLALGVQTPTSQAGLPADAEVFVDSTGDFGPAFKPFVAAEVIFRVQNVLADVTGYYEGGDAATIDAATSGSIAAASSIGNWLAGRTPSAKSGVLPLLLVPIAITGRWPGRRRP
jgi:hypothetical protein